MILTSLTLRNFCLFAGEHVLELDPGGGASNERPVVLFGGVNGAGKTTILDAVQLVLFGKRAQCSKRNATSYDRFLLESIHQQTNPAEGAAITLGFRYAARGRQEHYEVTRSWRLSGDAVREKVRVSRDGEADAWLSDNWHNMVEDLIPHGIAQLCFFDAEKIRFLAEDSTTSQALGQAIRSLLGLDLAERLIADAEVLRGRIAKRAAPAEAMQDLSLLEEQMQTLEAEIRASVQDAAALENRRLQAAEAQRKAEEHFARIGGKHWEERAVLQQETLQLESKREEIEEKLVELAASELPLAMALPSLRLVASQADRERSSTTTAEIHRILEERDEATLAHAANLKANTALVAQLRAFLQTDRSTRLSATRETTRLNLSENAAAALRRLAEGRIHDRQASARELLDLHESTARQLADINRSKEATPNDDAVAAAKAQLVAAIGAMSECDAESRRAERAIEERRYALSQLEAKYGKLRESTIDRQIKSEEDQRLLELLSRTRTVMQDYLRNITARKLDRLSQQITESFRYLLQKKSLVHRVAIDPESFAIELHGHDGSVLAKERLSEGEKQLFAISVLWGLAKCSSRPLPAIIDTPMGRLDAKHRDQLITRYFPRASHQVIVLSTDTEVDRRYFQLLEPAINRAYHLRYDERTRRTIPEPGYFWSAEPAEAAS